MGTIDDYVAKLRTLAQTCGFCVCLHDSLICNRIVLGVADASTQKQLLQHSKLNSQESIEICRSFEATNLQIRQMGEQNKLEEVNKVQPTKSRKRRADHGTKQSMANSNKNSNNRIQTIKNDHKPLEAIARKPLHDAPKWIWGMLLNIQKYDTVISYKCGPQTYLADTLSRAFLTSSTNTQGEFQWMFNTMMFSNDWETSYNRGDLSRSKTYQPRFIHIIATEMSLVCMMVWSSRENDWSFRKEHDSKWSLMCIDHILV